MHLATMKKEYMDKMLTWSMSDCLLNFAFCYLCVVMTGLGSPPEGTLDKTKKLALLQHLEHLAFSAIVFMLWTRSVLFLAHQ